MNTTSYLIDILQYPRLLSIYHVFLHQANYSVEKYFSAEQINTEEIKKNILLNLFPLWILSNSFGSCLRHWRFFIIGVLEARVNHLKSIPRTNYSSYKSFFTYEIFCCTHFYMEWWIAFPLQYVIWRRYKKVLPRLRSIRF